MTTGCSCSAVVGQVTAVEEAVLMQPHPEPPGACLLTAGVAPEVDRAARRKPAVAPTRAHAVAVRVVLRDDLLGDLAGERARRPQGERLLRGAGGGEGEQRHDGAEGGAAEERHASRYRPPRHGP